jgi:hypothetical protein
MQRSFVIFDDTVTASANGGAFNCGTFEAMTIVLEVSDAATEVGDTLDVFIDFSLDNAVWYNGGHFAQKPGNGPDSKHLMQFGHSSPGNSTIEISSDCGPGSVRPASMGNFMRVRCVVVDDGATNASFAVRVSALGR